ncbi:hypothetical protein CTheo_8859 [Ceratobasidium theobromae]|uniref:Transmembrane protein n=1 Tax=Ceratobasidium theobromae TaxID=1582974 RepID=A0A5N5Q8E2_9AGAM|nr:hypothetical protein CTheo_8859 [Ceratobasidium theobromae]
MNGDIMTVLSSLAANPNLLSQIQALIAAQAPQAAGQSIPNVEHSGAGRSDMRETRGCSPQALTSRARNSSRARPPNLRHLLWEIAVAFVLILGPAQPAILVLVLAILGLVVVVFHMITIACMDVLALVAILGLTITITCADALVLVAILGLPIVITHADVLVLVLSTENQILTPITVPTPMILENHRAGARVATTTQCPPPIRKEAARDAVVVSIKS